MFITLTDYYFNKCISFAEKQLETSKGLYAYRGESRVSKMKEDITQGKLAELAAYKYLKKKNYDVNKPDFSIYERVNKSYAPDLMTKCGKRIHVKGQGYVSMVRYGASWLLQKSDALVKNPDENDYILMVTLSGLEANILGVVSALDLLNNGLFEDPKVERYQHTKKAIYFDSIKQSGVSTEVL